MSTGYNPIYHAWNSMKTRCLNPKSQQFHNYGARGIKVCESWMDFTGFLKDMGKSYKPGLSLDRIDNNLGYFPANCRWSTIGEQSNNTRRNKWIEWRGETHTIAQWSRQLGMRDSTIRERVNRGWTGDKIFKPPTHQPELKSSQ
jgi:hypothetical protein